MGLSVGIAVPSEAEVSWVLGDRQRYMGEVAGSDLHVVEVTVPPGSGTPPHRHPSLEIFHMIEGEMTFGDFSGDLPRQAIAGPGAVVTVPSNAPHNYTNAGTREARMLVVLQRHMMDFFREIRTAAPPPGPPSEQAIAHLMEAARRHGVEILAGG